MTEYVVDRPRFREAAAAASLKREKNGIGTQNEKTLHAALKKYYSSPDSVEEAKVGRFRADLLLPDGIVEIQTGSVGTLAEKLRRLPYDLPVTVVLPVMQKKTLFWIDSASGELSPGRRSPKKGCFTDLLPDLYYFSDFLKKPTFTLIFFLYDGEEYKITSPKGSKGYGARRLERIPKEAVRAARFEGTREDYLLLLPEGLGSPFKAADFSRKTRFRGRKLSLALKTLELSGAVKKEKEGRAVRYIPVNGDAPPAP